MSASCGRWLWQLELQEFTSVAPSQRWAAEHVASHHRLAALGVSLLALHPKDKSTSQSTSRRMPRHSYLNGERETLVISLIAREAVR